MDVILGFIALLLVSYLASYQFKKFLQKWQWLDTLMMSGFLYIFIGVLMGPSGFNVLSKPVLSQLQPFIFLALGWVGFLIGIQFEWRLLKHVPVRLVALAQTESVIAVLGLFGGLFICLTLLQTTLELTNHEVWIASLILTISGAFSSSLTAHYYARTHSNARAPLRPLEFIISLHIFIPLLLLANFFSFFHEVTLKEDVNAAAKWFSLHILTGLLLGATIFFLLRAKLKETERMLLILGGITFSAGFAAHLHLSPIFVCFVAGICFANLPGFNNLHMEVILRHAERPIYLIMLIVAGSLWEFSSPLSFIILAIYFFMRFLSKGLSFFAVAKLSHEIPTSFPMMGSVLAQGPLAIALVVSFSQRFQTSLMPHIITAILGGAIINEIISGKLLRIAFPEKKS